MKRDSQRGSAMLVTMIVVVSLLAGAATIVQMQLSGMNAARIHRAQISSLYCAEAGLQVARGVVMNNYAQWPGSFGMTSEPTWLAAGIGSHDLDGDGSDDFVAYVRDNDDELPPATNDPTRDNDLRVFVISRCIHNPEVPYEIQELVEISVGGTCYRSQVGGCRNDGNTN